MFYVNPQFQSRHDRAIGQANKRLQLTAFGARDRSFLKPSCAARLRRQLNRRALGRLRREIQLPDRTCENSYI